MSVWSLSAINLYANKAFLHDISSVATINTLPYPYSRFGNVLMVDPVNGSDGIASRNGYPYKTVEQAVSDSTAGDTVWIMPGTYNLCSGLLPHAGSCLRGLNVQTCQLNLCNVTTATTMITMSSQVRIEDLTLNLHSASNVSLIGFEYPSGTSLNSKLRTAVVNVYSDYVGGNTVYGLHSPGTTATSFSSSSAIRACTINVSTASTGKVRGLLVDGPNRFAIRDTNIICTGPSNDNIGVETTNISAFAELKSSSIGGSLYDINRTSGNILLGFTDLIHNSANGNSFSVVVEGSTTFFGIVGNLQADTSYFVGPGTTAVNALPATAFPIPVTQDMALYTGVIQYTGSLTGVEQIILDVYRNNEPTHVYTISMGVGMQSKLNNTTSTDFKSGDTYYAIVRTIGNPDTGTFTATLGFY